MADRVSASIVIGGSLTASAYAELGAFIGNERALHHTRHESAVGFALAIRHADQGQSFWNGSDGFDAFLVREFSPRPRPRSSTSRSLKASLNGSPCQRRFASDCHEPVAREAQNYSLGTRRHMMTSIPTDYDAARAALTRLIPLAMADTGQARRVANFLMAWWNGPDLGHFEIADMFGLDVAVANDITAVIGFLGQNDRGAVYIDSLGFAEEMQDIIALWRKPATPPAN